LELKNEGRRRRRRRRRRDLHSRPWGRAMKDDPERG